MYKRQAWTLHLCNWAFRDPSHSGEYSAEELTPERLRVAHQWLTPPADGDLERFSLAFVLMEARAGEAVDAAAAAVSAAEERDPHRLAEHLERLAASMREASREFVVAMREDLVASRRWLELVQPTMAWALSRNGEESLPGPNGLQLPSWQICDTVLGIPRPVSYTHLTLPTTPYV